MYYDEAQCTYCSEFCVYSSLLRCLVHAVFPRYEMVNLEGTKQRHGDVIKMNSKFERGLWRGSLLSQLDMCILSLSAYSQAYFTMEPCTKRKQ